MGNLVTLTVIVTDQHLHFPMSFFISNISLTDFFFLIDFCSISVIIPKLTVISLTGLNSISLAECAAQIFPYVFFATVEFAVLVGSPCCRVPPSAVWAHHDPTSLCTGSRWLMVHWAGLLCYTHRDYVQSSLHRVQCDQPVFL